MSTYSNVRKQVGKPLGEITKDFFDEERENFIDGWYTGKVVNNNDPDKEGKCRIRVYGIFGNDIPDKDLPWALPDFNFIGSKVGNFIVPPVDALVKVYFAHGDVYLPHYSTKAVNQKSLPKRRMRNYPNNIVLFETDNGDYFEIDRESSQTTFHHQSGTEITINKTGNVSIDCKGKIFTIAGADVCDLSGKSTIIGSPTGPIKGTYQPILCSIDGALPTDSNGIAIAGAYISKAVRIAK